VDPVPDPILLRKSGSAGNRTRTSGSVARNSDYYTTEGDSFTFTLLFFFWFCFQIREVISKTERAPEQNTSNLDNRGIEHYADCLLLQLVECDTLDVCAACRNKYLINHVLDT
jgi:hypothetical protein